MYMRERESEREMSPRLLRSPRRAVLLHEEILLLLFCVYIISKTKKKKRNRGRLKYSDIMPRSRPLYYIVLH